MEAAQIYHPLSQTTATLPATLSKHGLCEKMASKPFIMILLLLRQGDLELENSPRVASLHYGSVAVSARVLRIAGVFEGVDSCPFNLPMWIATWLITWGNDVRVYLDNHLALLSMYLANYYCNLPG